jgi:hypothetical protein
MPAVWLGALIGAVTVSTLVLAGTADWEYLRARWRGGRALRRARRNAAAEEGGGKCRRRVVRWRV